MDSDDIMRVSEADREILERVLNVRRILDLKDVMQLLRSEIKRAGSQRAFARKAGVNVSVVSTTLRGRVLPSEKILRALNLSVVYLSN
jgi:transcriptional regulator with XRE-family HTH domain